MSMKEFLGWLNLLAFLLVVALVVFWFVATFTGDGVSDGEGQVAWYGFLALMGLVAVGYILDPSPPQKRRRRR